MAETKSETKKEKPNSTFESLFCINVNDRTEEKNGLKYLSWSWAWAEVKKLYPSAFYSIERFGENNAPYLYDEDLGYMVFTRVNINGEEHEMWLPVMDSANKAMLNHEYTYEVKKKEYDTTARKYVYTKETKTCAKASMFDVNKTIMRCLVKNLAMFGLGLYIYSGEDLPEDLLGDEEPKEQVEEIKKASPKQIEMLSQVYVGDNLTKLLELNGIDKLEDLPMTKASELIKSLTEKNKEKK